MNLFSHFAHLIKHRRRKVYAQNLLPCLLSIGKRKEPLVIESLTEFMKSFSRILLNCLTDGETMKLVDLFIDNLNVECAIKKRCAAQNIISILEHSVKKEFLMKSIVVKIQENLNKNQHTNSVLGSLGLLRLLMPMLVKSKDHHQKVLELLETCLNYLRTESNHSVINANLEVLNSLLTSAVSSTDMKELLVDDQMMLHKEMLLSRRSMSAFINLDSRKSSDTETLKTQDNVLQLPSATTSVMSTPNKSLMDFSDVEGDSFKSIDFEAEISSSPATMRNIIATAETISLKSTDSINSFFNSIASNTESVSKFFRKSSTESPAHLGKMNESSDERFFDFSISQLKDENTELPDSQTLPETAEMAMEDPKLDETLEMADSTCSIEPVRELYIGTIFDQSIVEYIVRLVTSKFLLDGAPKTLISDQIIRVSIKNLALSVLVGCVELRSDVLLIKLQKDFTDESMMVESLLSYLVDEDLRLGEEEKKKNETQQEESEEAANTSESFLEIKDDHFGECTTATFLDYFSPLSNSLDDQRLISLKNRIYEEKSKDREESAKKINRDLCQLLTRSEMVESKLPLMETTLKMPEDKDCQFVADVLMYSSHSDPVLRGNVYMIVGSFIAGVLRRNVDYQKLVRRNEIVQEALEFDKLVQLLLKGFNDEIHTVVKQTLTIAESLINLLFAVLKEAEIERLLNRLLLVFCNKYWLVQCKYCDVITKIDFELLRCALGVDGAEVYQRQIVDQLFELIKDSDFRVRNHASEMFPRFIIGLCESPQRLLSKKTANHLSDFVNENLVNFEAFFIDVTSRQTSDVEVELQLTRVLYRMSNFLMDVKDKNQHFGVIYALKVLVRRFSPIDYAKAWKEFNVLNVLMSFMNKHPVTALDVSCQCDLLEVISALVAARGILGSTPVNINEFLLHLLRILNIYGHLVNNTKPLLVSKQKSKDIFTSSKELAVINSLGFFGNDHFYLKLYLVLKSSYESYRMTINQDAEVKLKQLLHVTLKSLQTLLELRMMTADYLKLLEEAVNYLNQLISFQPEDCVATTKILLKFLFQRNFANRKNDLDVIRAVCEAGDAVDMFEKYENFLSFDAVEVMRENNIESSIKQFDPLVIQGLRMFSKSPANLQAIILDMLCQLLEFNVNYMQLDAKKVFVDFVMRQLEYIEGGLVMDGKLLAPRIVQFLIYLTKLKDKKLITVPKIINIIDNLLAATNPLVKDCGVQALLVLTMELFFRKSVVKGEPEVIDAHNKEMNAQREVVISMMLKFLQHPQIQNHLVWILIKSRVEPEIENVVDENEIHRQLVQCMKEEPAMEHNLIGFVSKNILLESKNFESLLMLYWSLLDGDVDGDTVKMLTLIQQQVMGKVEEVYLMNHIKLHQQKHNVEDCEALKTFVKLHQKVLLEYLRLDDQSLLQELCKFMTFKKFPTLLEILIRSLNIAEIVKVASKSRSAFSDAIQFLLSIDIPKNEIEVNIKSQENSNRLNLMEIFHRNLFNRRNDINAWNNEELMDFFKDGERLCILLRFSQSILLDSLLEDKEISRIILRKLTTMKIPLGRIKYLLENVHEECLMDSLHFVIAETAHGSKNCRIEQLVMAKKLHLVRNEILMGRESSKVPVEDLLKCSEKLTELKLNKKFPTFAKAIEEFASFMKVKNRREASDIDVSDLQSVIDEPWLLSRAKSFVSGSDDVSNGTQIAEMLFEIKSESQLITLLTIEDFNIKLLPATFRVSFEKMLRNFRIDCAQLNPHLNYMKVSPLLKISILIMMKNLEKLSPASDSAKVKQLAEILSIFLQWVRKLYSVSLVHVEAKLIEKFIGDNLLKPSFTETLINVFMLVVQQLKRDDEPSETILEAISDILTENRLWVEINKSEETSVDGIVSCIYRYLCQTLNNTEFVVRYQHPQLFDELSSDLSARIEITKQIIFIAKIQESYKDGEFVNVSISSRSRKVVEKLLNISRNLLRLEKFYQFAITPYEIILSYRSGDDLLVMQSEGRFKLKQIPIEYLSDSELLEHYVRRINRYGFTQRNEFEELFMTLLVLLNQWNEMQDVEEQFNIKQLCLQTNVELIVSCFHHPVIGAGENAFFHFPRCEKMKLESIGLKKLLHIQETLEGKLNVFYQPNLERVGFDNNIISCTTFDMNQFALNYTWQMIETREEVASAGSILTRNVTFYLEKLGIDFKSAIQLIYDLTTQMIDENPVLVLPQLAKLVDVLDNVEQFKWINRKMLSLYDSIAGEDTISHQYIVYLLCRSSAVLVQSLGELQQLQVIVNKYLGCNHIFIRNAALHGLLCLFESLCKTNTTMGGMSDEMKLIRNCIINYTNRNGIIYER